MTEQEVLQLRMAISSEVAELVREHLRGHDRELARIIAQGVGAAIRDTVVPMVATLEQRIRDLEGTRD